MNTVKKVAVALALFMSCSAASIAQIYVDIRPSRPVYVRPVAPSPTHVWIEEDWGPSGSRYEWRGGYWAEPRAGYVYRPGRWRHSSRGYYWQEGGWRAQGHRHRGNGHGHGHGHRR